MQKITIIGRLGRDASVRECQDGSKMLSFTVAVNGRYRGVEKTSWYDVSTFNVKRYENMLKYLTKGSSVIIIGELDADLDEGKDGTTRCRRSILADSIDFNSNSSSGGTQNNATVESTGKKKAESIPDDITDDDLMRRSSPKNAVSTSIEEQIDNMSDGDSGDDLPF